MKCLAGAVVVDVAVGIADSDLRFFFYSTLV